MGLRTAPSTIEDRVAAIEAWQRDLQRQAAAAPVNTRYLYTATGDILVAVAPGAPSALHVPTGVPAGAGGYVLRFNPSESGEVAWKWIEGA